MTNWTPGPWVIVDPFDEDDGTTYPAHVYGGKRGLEVCQFIGDWRVSDVMFESAGVAKSKKANAHLIAAAPDLYEALADLAAAYKSLCLMTGKTFYEDDCSQYQRSTAALAKARGETE